MISPESQLEEHLIEPVRALKYECRPDVCERATLEANFREEFQAIVHIADWCKNIFEVVSQLRINTDNSHHLYDVMLLINGVPAVQIELKTLGISPRRATEQIVNSNNGGRSLDRYVHMAHSRQLARWIS